MNKRLLPLGLAAMAAAMLATGCSSTDALAKFEQERKELNEFIVQSRAAEVIEKTDDKTIDALADNSTLLYKRTGGAMREYIEQSRGSQAVIEMTYFMHTTPKATDEELQEKAANFIESTCTEVEKKEMTPAKLIELGRNQYKYDAYLTFKETYKDAEARKQYLDSLAAGDEDAKKELEDINAGEKIFKERWAKNDWDKTLETLNGMLSDAGKIATNLGVVVQDTATKIGVKAQELAAIAQDPAFTSYVADCAPIKAKMTFANAESKKALEAEMAKIAEKSEYKDILAKQDKIEKDLEKLKKDSTILSDGIGTQVSFTAKALPWLIEQYIEMQSYASEE